MRSRSSRTLRTNCDERQRLLRVHAGGRLVEQQQLRLGRERARDLEPPLVAVGEVARVLVLGALGQAAVVEQLAAPCSRASASSRRCSRERTMLRKTPLCMRQCMPTSDVLERRHGAEEADVLERAADPERRDLVLRQSGDLVAVEDDLAGGRRVDAGEHVEERRLAGAVRADQAVIEPRGDRRSRRPATATRPPNSLRSDRARTSSRSSLMPGCASSSSLERPSSSCSSCRRRALGSSPSGRKSMNVHDRGAVDQVGVLRDVEVRARPRELNVCPAANRPW